MTEQARAEEHLRVIRSLMERATIYRAISAPTALVGGIASIAAAATLLSAFRRFPDDCGTFFWTWIAVLVLTATANTLFIWMGARKRNDPFVSSGMRLALIAILPAIIAALFFTESLFKGPFGILQLPGLWMTFYGLALLATSSFAPRSIVLLGWAFLGAGLFVWITTPAATRASAENGLIFAAVSMGLTFGLFHLIYAACTWPRKGQ